MTVGHGHKKILTVYNWKRVDSWLSEMSLGMPLGGLWVQVQEMEVSFRQEKCSTREVMAVLGKAGRESPGGVVCPGQKERGCLGPEACISEYQGCLCTGSSGLGTGGVQEV